jgi:type IV secretory pathway protease TraF
LNRLAKLHRHAKLPSVYARALFSIGAIAALVLGVGAHSAPTLILYNASASAPVGFYVRSTTTVSIGSYVTVRAASVAPAYAAFRDFDDVDDRFIKRVAAGYGAEVCAEGDWVRVGARLLVRHRRDASGRPLPAWSGCRVLAHDEFFLLGDTDDSFDSRYWGPVRRHDVEAVWLPLDHGGGQILDNRFGPSSPPAS